MPLRITEHRLLLQRSVVKDSTVVADLTEENAILRNEIVRKDAIIEGLLETLSASAMTTSLDVAKHRTPLTDLCQISKEACDAVWLLWSIYVTSNFPAVFLWLSDNDFARLLSSFGICPPFQVTPMLQAFYEKIADQRHGGASKLKSDATFFTIADGIVQHMFIE